MSTLSTVQQLILQHFVILPEVSGSFRRAQKAHVRRGWVKENSEWAKEIKRRWREKNPEREKELVQQWRKRNPDMIRGYKRQQRGRNPNYRLIKNLRVRVYQALHRKSKSARTLELLGCTIMELRSHLEAKFRPGMTWENYGPVWHVDHIRPCASFNLTDPAHQRECFNFKNLQPLFAEENRKKGDHYVT